VKPARAEAGALSGVRVLDLADESGAFAGRMQMMMQLLEKVAFQRVECRLAAYLLANAFPDGSLAVTKKDLATAVGSAREVISRRLDSWSRRGWVKTGRGTLQIIDTDALQTLAEEPV